MNVLLVIYDNDAYMQYFPMGSAYIAAALRDAGHHVSIWHQDIHHYPDEQLTDYLDRSDFDVVGIGVIAGYWQYRRLKGLAKAVNKARKRPFFILGGHGPSADAAYFLKVTDADVVIHGEGEITIVELLKAFTEKTPFSDVKGIAYRDNGTVRFTPPRPLIQNLADAPMPAYDMFPIEIYRLARYPHVDRSDFVMPVLSGRGCTFRCTFCYRMDKGHRPRPNELILEEIKLLQKDYGITYIDFADELLMTSTERVEDFCGAILRSNMKFRWYCNGRLNYATPENIALMRKAGCVFINYGIEALDDDVLKKMKKGLTVDIIEKGIQATLDAGVSPGFNIIFGNIGDTRETLQKAVDFLLKYDDGAQMRTIRPVTPYPGSALYDTAIKMGKLKDCEDFYEHKHINSDLLAVNFTDLTDDEFHQALMEANITLLENYFAHQTASLKRQTEDLYLHRNADFRGYRQT